MSDADQTPDAGDAQPTVEQPALAPDAAEAGFTPPSLNGASAPPAIQSERPELAVGAAFAGGLVLALFLKRLAR